MYINDHVYCIHIYVATRDFDETLQLLQPKSNQSDSTLNLTSDWLSGYGLWVGGRIVYVLHDNDRYVTVWSAPA